ncbi:dynein light intermediate chain [Arctopsyche grandis]|uniref:dynein light intermediate chain n=1 Tax=Arctopsyche grandis TaxID=121162 RepID=UPI00406D9128
MCECDRARVCGECERIGVVRAGSAHAPRCSVSWCGGAGALVSRCPDLRASGPHFRLGMHTGSGSAATNGPSAAPAPADNLWSSILEEVQNQGNTKLSSCKNILVLGDNESGKTTLIAKLQGVEDPKKGSGLEYAYIDVRDEYRDDHTRLSVWVLDGDPGHTNLLKFALSEKTFPHTLVILTVAMTTPWGLLDQLQSWASILGDHLDKLPISNDQRQEARHRCIRSWQQYTEPGDEMEQAGSPMKRSSRNLNDEIELNGDGDDGMPLPESVLTTNLGLDIVVVVTKTDYMTTLEKEHDYRDEHFDFMQQWIRRFCLQHGAALFYTSAKEDKNCDLLYKYLTHKIYGLPFRTPALVVEKDAVLIPAGWDTLKKVSILYENMNTCKPDDYYRDVVAPPATRKSGSSREAEVHAEDEQTFLQRQLGALQGSGGLAPGGPAGGGSPHAPRGESPLRSSSRQPGQINSQSSPKKLDGTKMSVGSSSTLGGEGVLANFFNSLLYKKTGSPGGTMGPGSPRSPAAPDAPLSPTPPADKAAVRSDAAAELDRLTRAKKLPSIDLNASDC